MLAVRDLAIARSGMPVLAGLSFDVAAGQALILRGPNGIGKTTLLRVLAGLQDPVAGLRRFGTSLIWPVYARVSQARYRPVKSAASDLRGWG